MQPQCSVALFTNNHGKQPNRPLQAIDKHGKIHTMEYYLAKQKE